MTRKQFDILMVVVLVAGGLLGYPWARVRWQLALLGSPNAEQAIDGQDALTVLGPKALPAVVRFVRRSTQGTPRRLGAEVALRRQFGKAQNTESEDVVQLALDLAADDWDQAVQSRAIQWLSLSGRTEAQPLFQALLGHPDSVTREEALRAVLAAGGADTVAHVAPLLHDPDPDVQQSAAIALGRLTDDVLVLPRGDTGADAAERERLVTAWLARHHLPPDAATPAYVSAREPLPAPKAPAFALPDLENGAVRLADFRGKPVLLNFWATWCPPCEHELPALAAVAEEFQGRAVVVGVTQEFESTAMAERELEAEGAFEREEHDGHQHGTEHLDDDGLQRILAKQREMIAAKVEEKGLGYPIVIGNETVGDAYGVDALPVSVLVSPDGTILRRLVGPRSAATFRALLDAAAR